MKEDSEEYLLHHMMTICEKNANANYADFILFTAQRAKRLNIDTTDSFKKVLRDLNVSLDS